MAYWLGFFFIIYYGKTIESILTLSRKQDVVERFQLKESLGELEK